MTYLIEILFFAVPLFTVPAQSKVIGFLIDLFGWRKGRWAIGDFCIKKGNVIAFGMAFSVAVLTSAVDLIATGDPVSPTKINSLLGLLWWGTWKFYSDNQLNQLELEADTPTGRVAELWDKSGS